jgi:hypothetical protein
MKKLTLVLTSSILLWIVGCGTTETTDEIDPSRGFDMWEYMTSPLDYEVEYAVYQNGTESDYYVETNQVSDNGSTYERQSDTGTTTLYLSSSYILMKEPVQDVEVSRYVNLGDSHVFQASDIDDCTVERFYATYAIHGSSFDNVLMINCLSNSGLKQEFYYGYSEGIVAIYKDDNSAITEYIKVNEKRIY